MAKRRTRQDRADSVPLVAGDRPPRSLHLGAWQIPRTQEVIAGLVNWARGGRRHGRPRPAPTREPLDDYGLPVSWRNDPPRELDPELAQDWSAFERWCEERGLRAFPASVPTCLRFLLDPPVVGPQLHDIWWAVQSRHGGFYWHVDANPVQWLHMRGIWSPGGGVDVLEDGTVILPDEVLVQFGLQS